jgi:lipoprotein-releasing system permease protein
MRVWLARQRYLVDYAMAAMARQRARNLGLLLVYTLLTAVLASVLLLGSALRREAAAMLQDTPDVVLQGMRMGRHEMSRSRRRGQAAWACAVPMPCRAAVGLPVRHRHCGANYTLQVPPSTAQAAGAASRRARSCSAKAWRGCASCRSGSAGVPGVAQRRGAEPEAQGGAARRPPPLVSSDLVLLSEADFRRFFQLADDEFTDIALRVRNPKEVAKVAEKAGIALRQHRVITREDLLRTYEAIFSWREGMLLALLSGALLAFAHPGL